MKAGGRAESISSKNDVPKLDPSTYKSEFLKVKSPQNLKDKGSAVFGSQASDGFDLD